LKLRIVEKNRGSGGFAPRHTKKMVTAIATIQKNPVFGTFRKLSAPAQALLPLIKK